MIGPLLIGAWAGVAATATGLGYAAFAPGCQWFGPVIPHGAEAGLPRVALTFDDGPTPEATERVIERLNELGVPACFFCIGRNADAAPQLLRTMDHAGHLIANHSYDHARHGAFHGRRYWVDQLRRTNTAIEDAVGRRPKLFRPPMGVKTPRVLYASTALQMHTVTWSHRAFDTRITDATRITTRLTRRLTPGSVLVLHDGAEPGRHRDARATCEALPNIIDQVRRSGFVFARLDELLGLRGYADPVSSVPVPA